MSNAEQQIEQEIQDKGLDAPRLTPEHIDSKIKAVEYILARDVCKSDNGVEIFDAPLPLQTLTFCILTLENGFTVTGESACVSPENFDAEIGKKVAYDNARDKIWQLEGYLLKERLYQQQGTDGIATDSKPPIQFQAINDEPPMQPQVVNGSLNPLNPSNFTQYVGTKELLAMPMTREEWCEYRGWQVPSDEDGNDDGYMVQYLDGGKPNHPDHPFYISWSPKDVFERTYREVNGEPLAQATNDNIKSSDPTCNAQSCSGVVGSNSYQYNSKRENAFLVVQLLTSNKISPDVRKKAEEKMLKLLDELI